MKTRNIAILMICMLFASYSFAQYGTGLLYDDIASSEFSYKKPDKGYAGDLPDAFSLKAHTPYVKNQGNYGTCTSWAVAYSAFTTAYAFNMGLTNRNTITGLAFCPYFVYNQVKSDATCSSGSSIPLSILLLIETGAKKFYAPVIGCGTEITSDLLSDAANFKIQEAYILYDEGSKFPAEFTAASLTNYLNNTKAKPDHSDFKAALTSGSPIVFGAFIPNSFFSAKGKLWEPSYEEKQNIGAAVLSNTGMHQMHAMTIVGYDDNKYGGAYQIMNSWGDVWGDNGFIWVKYDDLALIMYEAYYLDLGASYLLSSLIDDGCVSGDCSEGYGTLQFSSGARYEGSFSNGQYNGYGIYTWSNGEVYAGQWKNDKRHGEGTRYLPNGEYGTCKYADDKLVGGFAQWTYNNGDTYYGVLSADFNRIGYGEYTFAGGGTYEGSWKSNVREGLGTMKYSNGDLYIGEWSDDSPNGLGMLIHPNGKIDAGSWSYGKMISGQTYGYAAEEALLALREYNAPEPSALLYASADCEDGDCLFGEGKRVYKGGATYKGEFKDGVEDGFGTMTYADGTKVIGNWKQGYNYGVARWEYTDGLTAIAQYNDGTLDGYVLLMSGGNMVIQVYQEGVYMRQVQPAYTPGANVGGSQLNSGQPKGGMMIETQS